MNKLQRHKLRLLLYQASAYVFVVGIIYVLNLFLNETQVGTWIVGGLLAVALLCEVILTIGKWKTYEE